MTVTTTTATTTASSSQRVGEIAWGLLMEREQELASQPVEDWWGVYATLRSGPARFEAVLADAAAIETEAQAVAALEAVRRSDTAWVVSEVVRRRDRFSPPLRPFDTALLLMEGVRLLKLDLADLWAAAQRLHADGLISPPVTRSTAADPAASAEAAMVVEALYGPEMLGRRPAAPAPGQGEGIRPTSPARLPEQTPADDTALRVYELVWKRFIAAHMAPPRWRRGTVELELLAPPAEEADPPQALPYRFYAPEWTPLVMGSRLLYPHSPFEAGWGEVCTPAFPALQVGQAVTLERLRLDYEPLGPARYSLPGLIEAVALRSRAAEGLAEGIGGLLGEGRVWMGQDGLLHAERQAVGR